MTGIAALTLCATFTACSHDDIETVSQEQIDKAKYDQAFLQYVGGSIASNQTWGFGNITRGITRSIETPVVPDIDVNAIRTDAADILAKSVEVSSSNYNFNDAYATTNVAKGHEAYYGGFNSSYIYSLSNDDPDSQYYWNECYGKMNFENPSEADKQKVISDGHAALLTYYPAAEDVVEWNPNYITNFKISSAWSGAIPAMGNAGVKVVEYSINDNNTVNIIKIDTVAKTVYIDNGGTWTIPAGTQTTVGQGITKSNGEPWGTDAIIIVGNGGTLEVNGTLNMANCARLIVLPGGKVTGSGLLQINNGNFEGAESYNGGTIDVAVFNNNFGKFHNYGSFLSTEYRAGAQESNFYNHGLAHIQYTGNGSETPNARIFNNCQFYCEGNMRLRNYEGVGGSALIVGGQFMPFGSADGTTLPSYVSLAAGALVKCATLYNGASWTGPTSGGYGALEITEKIDYLNWVQDHPEQGGYFANNLYVKCATWQNDPAGQGYHNDDASDEYNYAVSRAEYKFWQVAANSTGNGNVTKVTGDANWLINADADFKLGEDGCTPGFKGDVTEPDPTPSENPDPTPDPKTTEDLVYDLRVIAEDLSATQDGDFDFNDVVFDVKFDASNAYIKLQAAGGTLPLRIDGKDAWEVHKLFGVATVYMVNTGAGDVLDESKGNKRANPIDAVEFRLGRGIADAADANSIKIEVQKNGVWQELKAPKGEPASKLAVGTDYTWLEERTSIKGKFTNFLDWVNNGNFESEWWKTTTNN